METDELPLASEFQPLEGEANFGPTLLREVKGGTHIAPECVVMRDGKFFMVEWPSGLKRHDTHRTVRFPHGLIRFGETVEECAKRLVKDQMGAEVERVKVLEIDSYVDDANHWHIEPLLLVTISHTPIVLPSDAGQLIEFKGSALPDGAVWGTESFKRMFDAFIKPTLKEID